MSKLSGFRASIPIVPCNKRMAYRCFCVWLSKWQINCNCNCMHRQCRARDCGVNRGRAASSCGRTAAQAAQTHADSSSQGPRPPLRPCYFPRCRLPHYWLARSHCPRPHHRPHRPRRNRDRSRPLGTRLLASERPGPAAARVCSRPSARPCAQPTTKQASRHALPQRSPQTQHPPAPPMSLVGSLLLPLSPQWPMACWRPFRAPSRTLASQPVPSIHSILSVSLRSLPLPSDPAPRPPPPLLCRRCRCWVWRAAPQPRVFPQQPQPKPRPPLHCASAPPATSHTGTAPAPYYAHASPNTLASCAVSDSAHQSSPPPPSPPPPSLQLRTNASVCAAEALPLPAHLHYFVCPEGGWFRGEFRKVAVCVYCRAARYCRGARLGAGIGALGFVAVECTGLGGSCRGLRSLLDLLGRRWCRLLYCGLLSLALSSLLRGRGKLNVFVKDKKRNYNNKNKIK
ncbi:hypothetical protein BX661DRAFT_187937 [Kickxella alabastrina]|uniref:uncharacterized protein n=1 Tax=Kickxella alabastrina TaxID=61397 RepID=UPI00221ED650|nr:uncharacterized protein BX661DRAFT_187937 [Kickxella alabastrina]KAI7821786.1 hypothetical protein BX661DRAFT_187937 [Kickxella alabastrina]